MCPLLSHIHIQNTVCNNNVIGGYVFGGVFRRMSCAQSDFLMPCVNIENPHHAGTAYANSIGAISRSVDYVE